MDSPAPGEAASSPRSWDSGEPARPETSLALSLSALASPQADRSAPQASLPGQSLFLTLGWTCDTQYFSVTSPSRWKRGSFIYSSFL